MRREQFPIQQGYMEGFYDDVMRFMRNLFSGCLKDNRHLSYGFLTGILRVAKESIFSGMNNLIINSIMDQKYSEYFGFTADEIMEMAAYYHAREKYGEICDWYDGYRFGTTEIFNSWSVINYFRNDCQPGAYWQSTGSNDIIGEVLTEADADIYEKLQDLLQGETVTAYIDTGGETFYHGFMLGLCAAMEQYKKRSNRESGYGRYDIQLTPKSKNLPGIIIELKAAKDCSEDELKELSKKALQQIDEKKYDTELREAGITDVIKYGVAFCGKKVEIAVG